MFATPLRRSAVLAIAACFGLALTLAAQSPVPAHKPKRKAMPALRTPKKASAPASRPSEQIEEVAVLETESGTIVVRFFPQVAPNHVSNFKELVSSGFYTGTRFHRIIPGFMIQGGDPNTRDLARKAEWGSGDGPRKLTAEFNKVHHARGILSMARSNDPNSASSQFFIMHGDAPFLDGKYTVFGEAVSGMEIVDAIVNGPKQGDQATSPVMIKSARLEKLSLAPSQTMALLNGAVPISSLDVTSSDTTVRQQINACERLANSTISDNGGGKASTYAFTNGEYQHGSYGDEGFYYLQMWPKVCISYDFDGDGYLDAATFENVGEGGSDYDVNFLIYYGHAGGFNVAARHYIDDRPSIDSLIRTTNGELLITGKDHGGNDPMCCPTHKFKIRIKPSGRSYKVIQDTRNKVH